MLDELLIYSDTNEIKKIQYLEGISISLAMELVKFIKLNNDWKEIKDLVQKTLVQISLYKKK